MLKFAICQIDGKQYKVVPNKPLELDYQGEVPTEGKTIKAKTLLTLEDGKISIGTPFLEKDLSLRLEQTQKKDKIRVAKFHAKANYRRVKGSRAKVTIAVLA